MDEPSEHSYSMMYAKGVVQDRSLSMLTLMYSPQFSLVPPPGSPEAQGSVVDNPFSGPAVHFHDLSDEASETAIQMEENLKKLARQWFRER